MSEVFAVNLEQKENLVRVGDDINLTNKDLAMRNLLVGVGWEHNAFDSEAVDVDVSCFLLDKNLLTRLDEDFVFYNNPEGCGGAVKHKGDSRHGAGDGDDETLLIDLHGLPFDVVRILIVISIYDAIEKDQNLSVMRNVYVRTANADTNIELTRYEFGEHLLGKKDAGMAILALDREGPKWHLKPMNEAYANGLGEIAAKFGIVVAEKR